MDGKKRKRDDTSAQESGNQKTNRVLAAGGTRLVPMQQILTPGSHLPSVSDMGNTSMSGLPADAVSFPQVS